MFGGRLLKAASINALQLALPGIECVAEHDEVLEPSLEARGVVSNFADCFD